MVALYLPGMKTMSLTENLKRFAETLKKVATYRFNNKTVMKSDWDDGNWGPFGGPP
jgi:hypothetical protein